MSTSNITIDHDDETGKCQFIVTGSEGRALMIAHDVMRIVSETPKNRDNFKGHQDFVVN